MQSAAERLAGNELKVQITSPTLITTLLIDFAKVTLAVEKLLQSRVAEKRLNPVRKFSV